MEAETLDMKSGGFSQSVLSTQLELAYERALRKADRIYEEERVRAIRVQLLLLEHENEDLQEQAEKDEDERQHMEDINEELRAHLADVEADLQQTQMDLKARLRDLDHLRTEVNALNVASTDATKLLAEKLTLARELNIVKPELEHLRSQSSTNQKLLSEKLSLQREVGSLQVELETEKRAVQRIKAREESASRDDSASITEIETLRKELAKAKRDALKISSTQEDAAIEIERLNKQLASAQRDVQKQSSRDDATNTAEIDVLRKDLAQTQRNAQKTDREIRKKTIEWENEKEVLEGKLDAFRNKLRSTKEQLHEAQEEIEKVQAAKMAQSAGLTKARMNGTAVAAASVANPRKRNVARFDPDMTIGTPGNGGLAAKKPRISVNVGDKSTFSITPFLNRTLSTLPETPAEDGEESARKEESTANQEVNNEEPKGPASKIAAKTKPAKSRKETVVVTKVQVGKALKESTNAKVNTAKRKAGLDKLMEESSDVDEDDAADKENSEQTTSTSDEMKDPAKTQKTLSKRPTIFDEEDRAPAPKIRTLGFGAGLGRLNLKAKPVGKGKMLAEFSPLKKDRRAVKVLE